MYFVYILRSRQPKEDRFYIGVSRHLLLRLREHNSPFNTGYTRSRYWEIVYVEGYKDMYSAYDREKKLKQYGNVWYGVMRRIKRTIS
jgi:predicted GIY-YIG superfamily endonuclease